VYIGQFNIIYYVIVRLINFYFKCRTWRLAAYRQFTYWVHQNLGQGVRRVVPACAVKIIHDQYPSDDGQYRGFLEATN
jgi:hypothetical protein